MPLWRKLMREHSELAAVHERAGEYKRLISELESAKELLDEPDMADMAREEIADIESRLPECERALKLLLLPKDPDDFRNVVLEVRAGAGGDEAGLFGYELVRMYQHYADSQRLEGRNDAGRRNRAGRHKGSRDADSGSGRVRAAQVRKRRTPRSARASDRIRRDAYIPQPRPWPCCPRSRTSILRSIRTICA